MPASYNITDSSETLNNMSRWPPSQSVLHHVKGMGVEFYSKFKYQVKHCYRILNDVIGYYNLQDRVFVFRDNLRLVFSLDDMFRLTGLPISGKPVVASEIIEDNMFRNAFGVDPLDEHHPNGLPTLNEGKKIRVKWLKDTYQNVGTTVGSVDELGHVRAYMLYFLSSCVIPDTSDCSYVPTMWLQLV